MKPGTSQTRTKHSTTKLPVLVRLLVVLVDPHFYVKLSRNNILRIYYSRLGILKLIKFGI